MQGIDYSEPGWLIFREFILLSPEVSSLQQETWTDFLIAAGDMRRRCYGRRVSYQMTPNEQSVAVRGKVGAGIRISSADSGACEMC